MSIERIAEWLELEAEIIDQLSEEQLLDVYFLLANE